MMGGMDDMNAQMPPMGAEQDMSPDGMDENMPPEGDMSGGQDDMMGGGPNAMGEDPNAVGGSPEGYDQLSNKGKAAVDAYTKSIADEENGGQDNDEMQPDMGGQMPQEPGMPAESKFNFKSIIDETFSTIFGDGNQSNFERGVTDRPQTVVGEDALTQLDNPFLPR